MSLIVGTYVAFKTVETAEADGKFIHEATRRWSPALRYTLSYRRDRVLNPNMTNFSRSPRSTGAPH